MDIQFKKFQSEIAGVVLLSREVKVATSKELISMENNHQALIKNGLEQHSASYQNMAFKSLTSGQLIFYDHMELDYDRRVKDLLNRHDKQYLWLVVDAYEYFKDFIGVLYDNIHKKDPTNFPKGRSGLIGELKNIRKIYPTLLDIERNNSLLIDLRFTICLLRELRNAIVHDGCKVKDYQKFLDNTFRCAEIENNEPADCEYLRMINYFILENEGVYHISMLRLQGSGKLRNVNYIENIINWLLSYTHYIYYQLLRPSYFSSI